MFLHISHSYLQPAFSSDFYLLFEVTDLIKGSNQNVSLPKDKVLRKESENIIVPPKEMLLLFSIGIILTNYVVKDRKT